MDKELVILYMRSGGIIVTQLYREGDTIETLKDRLSGGVCLFKDSLWNKDRELAVNLADVSVIEIIK